MTSAPAADTVLAGVELGGTKCICILAAGPDDVRGEVTIPTTTPDETLDAIRRVLADWDYAELGIASFGPLDLAAGRIVATPKPGWSGADLRSLAAPDVPYAIDTDVNGAALAEGLWGGARGLESWAYITVGTGIGVGTVNGGQPIRGLGHSEAGHLRVGQAGAGWAGICPYHGDCVEGLASGPAIAARAGMRGDAIANDHPVWGEVAETLARLCHNLVLATLPQRILIGGGVPQRRPQLLPLIRAHLLESLAAYGQTGALAGEIDSFIAPPALGDRAGPLGAIALATRNA